MSTSNALRLKKGYRSKERICGMCGWWGGSVSYWGTGQKDIPDAVTQCEKPHVRQISLHLGEVSITALNHFSHLRVTFPLEPV